MKKNIVGILLLSFCLLLLCTGCRKSIPVTQYGSTVPYSEKMLDNSAQQEKKDRVKAAIVDAGSKLGWIMKPVDENTIEGILRVRSHTIVVVITYDMASYIVTYKDSTNLNYKNGNIHPQYRNWVMNLQKHIDIELSKTM
ncbi:hypothetical protein MASR1M90_19400 [Desulfovibrionales bacterium]